MSEVKHTPTPWGFEESEYSVIITRDGFSIGAMFNSKVSGEWLPALPNAAHIVKCVNMHDELVEALKCLFTSYKELADSGDAGFWKLEEQEEGEKALLVLKKAGVL